MTTSISVMNISSCEEMFIVEQEEMFITDLACCGESSDTIFAFKNIKKIQTL